MAAADVEYRCFVGGLSWDTTDRSLESAFRTCGGLLEAKIVVDRDTSRPRGFGFVTFRDEQSMEDAIDSMDGKDLDGRNIKVSKAQPKSGGRGYGSYRGGRNDRNERGSGNSGCFKCGESGHRARECADAGYSGDRYSRGSYGSTRNGDRYGSSRSGPYDRPSIRSSYY